MTQDPVLVTIFQSVAKAMVIPGYNEVHYEPGRAADILRNLSIYDNSITMKGMKYPLLAVRLPMRQFHKGAGNFQTATIDRIVLATNVTRYYDDTEFVIEKYLEDGSYTKILHPMRTEFFRCLALNPFIVGLDPEDFIYTHMDNPCQQQLGEGSNDYIDSIEILNLELTLTQIKNCK